MIVFTRTSDPVSQPDASSLELCHVTPTDAYTQSLRLFTYDLKVNVFEILHSVITLNKEVKLRNFITILAAATCLAGCSENKSTNERYEGRFAVSSNVGEVKYKITEEVVRGEGCSGGFLGIPTGDRNFIPSGVDLGTREGRAQAAAIYDALYGKESGQLGTDIIVQPTFNINTSGVPLIAKQACATVVGYRGIVTGVN